MLSIGSGYYECLKVMYPQFAGGGCVIKLRKFLSFSSLVFSLPLIISLAACGGSSTSSTNPQPASLSGNWHFVLTRTDITNATDQFVLEVNFNSQNEVTNSFCFVYFPSGSYYTAACPAWSLVASGSVSGDKLSLTMGDFQLNGTVSGSSIAGTFTYNDNPGSFYGTFTGTSVGDVPQTTFSGITNENSLGPVATGLAPGCYADLDIINGILTSTNSLASLSGQYSCGSNAQDFVMQGSQVGYAFLLSGTFGSTVAYYPPGQLPGVVYLYLFSPTTGQSGGAILLQ
jgi:hypothetical protein